MPTLPVYNAKQNVDANISAPLRNEATQPFQDQQKVVGALENVTQQWSNLNDEMQFTKAKTNAQLAIAQQEQLAHQDPNPDNAQAHIDAIKSVATKSIDGIDNQRVAQKAALEINGDAAVSSIKINSIFLNKKLLSNDLTLENYASVSAQNKSNAITQSQSEQVDNDFTQTINRNYTIGAISEGRAKSLIDNYRMGVVKNDLAKEGALHLDQSQVEAELNKGQSGRYKDLSTDQNTEAKRMVRLQIRDNVEMGVGAKLDNRVDVIKKISSGELTWQNADAITKIAMNDPKLGEAMQAVLDRNLKGKEYKPQEAQNKDFAKLIDNIFSSKTKEEVSNYLVDTLYSGANQNMSKDKLSILVNAAEKKGAGLPTMKGSTNGSTDPAQQQIDNSVKHIQNFVKENPKSENVFVDFFKNLFGGSHPAQAKDDAIKTYNLQKYPWMGTVPSGGKIMVDKNGNKAKVFPDGTIQEVK